MASQYATTRPVGGEKESAEVGFFVNGSLDLLGRYFVNASYKTAGSSKFGSKHRFAPVWSAGIGWNLHKEGFMNFDWLNILRLRFSVGSTANVTFTPYQALTTYLYDSDLIHYGGMGAVPITMGNPDMKWQVTRKYNWGLTATFWKERDERGGQLLREQNEGCLEPLTLPSSVGVSSVLVNMGKLQNSGYEFSISAQVVKRNNLLWMVMVNGSHVFDKLTSISDALKAENMAAYYGVKPQPMSWKGDLSSVYMPCVPRELIRLPGRRCISRRTGITRLLMIRTSEWRLGTRIPCWRGVFSRACRTGDSR